MNNRQAVKTLKRIGYAAVGALMLSYCASRFARLEPKAEKKMSCSERLAYEEKKVMAMPLQLGTACASDTVNRKTRVSYLMKNGDTLYSFDVMQNPSGPTELWNDKGWRGGGILSLGIRTAEIASGGTLLSKLACGTDALDALEYMRKVPCSIRPYGNWLSFFVSNVKDFVIDETPLPLCPAGDSALANAEVRSSKVSMNPWNVEERKSELKQTLGHESGHDFHGRKVSAISWMMASEQDRERQAERYELAYLYDDAINKAGKLRLDSGLADNVKRFCAATKRNGVGAEIRVLRDIVLSEADGAKKEVLQNSISYDKLKGKQDAEASRAKGVIATVIASASLATLILLGAAGIATAFRRKKNGDE